ncbi:MAG: AAA family ATPase [Desulfurococcales archaeon]|nr:AAA family ATPase [Desulfurococcales archaeon]MCE4622238.1 AAA family ATPase [Desulfurococcales archaeon]MCE4629810.1 AAA family ATPase [Desulfurococcales archaeon]
MISRAVQVLEDAVRKHALAAMAAEKRGDYEIALYNMKKAVEILENIIRNYPDHPMISLYIKSLKQYKLKVKQLESKLLPASGGPGEEEYRVEIRDGKSPDLPPEFVLKEKPNVTFDDIAGLEDAKEAIKEAIIYPIKRPDLFPLGWPRGILLYGPPGTGKTMLGAAVANEVDGEFLYVSAASIMSKWLGEGEKNVKRLFDYARKKAEQGTPVIIFIDEIDDLLGVHSSEVGGEVRVRNQFLKEMDGLQDKGKKLHVYVIGATNKPWKLDDPFVRRFQKRIYVPLPNKEARKKLLEMLTAKIKLASDVDLDKLADMLEGYNGSDIKDIVFDAYMRTVKDYFKNGSEGDGPRPVSMRDFEEVIKRRKPSVNPESLRKLEEWRRKFNAV